MGQNKANKFRKVDLPSRRGGFDLGQPPLGRPSLFSPFTLTHFAHQGTHSYK